MRNKKQLKYPSLWPMNCDNLLGKLQFTSNYFRSQNLEQPVQKRNTEKPVCIFRIQSLVVKK